MSMPAHIVPPFQVGGTWSSQPISAFNDLCIQNAVSQTFSFSQVREMPPGWTVSLQFGFDTLSGDGEEFAVSLPWSFGSKKEAKAAASSEALPILTEAVENRNRDSMDKTLDGNDVGAENQNWIGLLGEHCQQSRKPMPHFQQFGLGLSHSMEVTISDRPDEPFGGRAVLFTNKKAAKANAAHEAVVWLRENGRMPRNSYASKYMASAVGRIGASALGPSGSPLAIRSSSRENITEAGSTSKERVDGYIDFPDPSGQKEYSLGQQITALCQKLGFTQPAYRLDSDQRFPSVWSGAAYFFNDPAVVPPRQPVGEVKMIFGKQRAKDEISKRVLRRLREILAEREKEFMAVSVVPVDSLDV